MRQLYLIGVANRFPQDAFRPDCFVLIEYLEISNDYRWNIVVFECYSRIQDAESVDCPKIQ